MVCKSQGVWCANHSVYRRSLLQCSRNNMHPRRHGSTEMCPLLTTENCLASSFGESLGEIEYIREICATGGNKRIYPQQTMLPDVHVCPTIYPMRRLNRLCCEANDPKQSIVVVLDLMQDHKIVRHRYTRRRSVLDDQQAFICLANVHHMPLQEAACLRSSQVTY